MLALCSRFEYLFAGLDAVIETLVVAGLEVQGIVAAVATPIATVERLFAFEKDGCGNRLRILFRKNDQEMLASGQPRRNDEWVDYPDGRRVLLDTLKSPVFDEGGKIIGLVGVCRDITGREFGEGQVG